MDSIWIYQVIGTMITTIQLITILSLFLFTTVKCVTVFKLPRGAIPKGAWTINAIRTCSVSDSRLPIWCRKWKSMIDIPEGSYYLGNTVRCDIRIRATKPNVCLFVNVQKDNVYVSVLKGSVQIGNRTFEPDKSKRVSIHPSQVVRMNDIEVTFRKEA